MVGTAEWDLEDVAALHLVQRVATGQRMGRLDLTKSLLRFEKQMLKRTQYRKRPPAVERQAASMVRLDMHVASPGFVEVRHCLGNDDHVTFKLLVNFTSPSRSPATTTTGQRQSAWPKNGYEIYIV